MSFGPSEDGDTSQHDDDDDENPSCNPQDSSSADSSSTTRLYSVLNVSRDASLADIQKSYKLLSKSFHPDKTATTTDIDTTTSTTTTARTAFDQVKLAHDVLSDDLLRFCYDHAGLTGVVLIRRAQQQYDAAKERHAEQQQDGGRKRTGEDDDDSDGNLFVQLRRHYKTNPQLANKLLQRMLHDYATANSRDAQTTMEASLHMAPIVYERTATSNRNALLAAAHTIEPPLILGASDTTSQLQFTTRHSITNTCHASCTAICAVQSTAATKWQTLLTLDATTARATQLSATIGMSPRQLQMSSSSSSSVLQRQHQSLADGNMERSNHQRRLQRQQQQQQNENPPIQLALRTSRTFLNGTFTMLALQTSLAKQTKPLIIHQPHQVDARNSDDSQVSAAVDPENMSPAAVPVEASSVSLCPTATIISLTSIRNIRYSSDSARDDSPSNKLQACWKIGIQPMRHSKTKLLHCRLAQIMVSLQTLAFPQYRLQLNLGGGSMPIAKFKCTSDPNHGLRGSFATNEILPWLLGFVDSPNVFRHWKLTWLTKPLLGSANQSPQHPQHWQLQYGLKYHDLTRQWAVVCQLHGSMWNIKIPILCGASAESPILLMASLLLGQVLDHYLLDPLQKHTKMAAKKKSTSFENVGSVATSVFGIDNPYWLEAMAHTARKKRQFEASVDGLVILSATSTNKTASSLSVPLEDVLQFWVVDSRLELGADVLNWMTERPTNDHQSLPWWKRLLRPFTSIVEPICQPFPVELIVRYQYREFVYETVGITRLFLPTPAATCLGPIGQVK